MKIIEKFQEYNHLYNRKINHENNFDIIRLCLALIVCLQHIFIQFIKDENYTLAHALRRIGGGDFAVLMFFSISAFLITRSLINQPELSSYVKKRIARLYPPIVIIACIMLLDACFSHKSKEAIMTIFTHFLVLQDIMVGCSKGMDVICHGTYWTLTVEFQFYIILPILLFIYNYKKPLFFVLLLALYFISLAIVHRINVDYAQNIGFAVLARASFISYIAYFIPGILAGIYYDKIVKSQRLTLLCYALVPLSYYIIYYHPTYIMVPFAYLIALLFFALMIKYLGKICFFGDLSYGIYLYHYPIFEMLARQGLFTLNAYYSITIALVVAFAVAFLSYHLVEKRILKLAHGRKEKLA